MESCCVRKRVMRVLLSILILWVHWIFFLFSLAFTRQLFEAQHNGLYVLSLVREHILQYVQNGLFRSRIVVLSVMTLTYTRYVAIILALIDKSYIFKTCIIYNTVGVGIKASSWLHSCIAQRIFSWSGALWFIAAIADVFTHRIRDRCFLCNTFSIMNYDTAWFVDFLA